MKRNNLRLRDLSNLWSMLNLLRSDPIEPIEFVLKYAHLLGFDKLDKTKCKAILNMLGNKIKEELDD